MFELLFIMLGGLLGRADGWGPANEEVVATWPKWQLKLAQFFSAWTCGGLFALLTLIYTMNPLIALFSGLAFVMFRLPGFDGWQKWWGMFWRGAWTSFIGFTALSLAVHHNPYYGWLFLPMGALEALAYAGSYKWLPGRIPNWAVHVTAEIFSTGSFAALVLIIIGGVGAS